MSLEMPSPAEADSLRTILLIVLGVMILTIPVVCVIVVARVTAQRKQRPTPGRQRDRSSDHMGGVDTMMVAGASTPAAHILSDQDDEPHRRIEADHCGDVNHTTPSSNGESSWMGHSSSFGDGGGASSDSGNSSGRGGSGGGGTSG